MFGTETGLLRATKEKIANLSLELNRSNIAECHFNGFIVEVYRGSAFRDNKEVLAEMAKLAYSDLFQRSREESDDIVNKNMAYPNANIIWARKENEYGGFATGCKFVLPIGEGERIGNLRIGYLSDRALDLGFREKGLGTLFYELYNLLYDPDKDPLDMIFHRSQNAAAIWSAIKSGVFRYGYFPFGDGKTPTRYGSNPLVRDAAYALYPKIIRHSQAYYPDRGLSIGEYKQPGQDYQPVYIPHTDHVPTMSILRMIGRLGGRIPRGDAFIAGGPRRSMKQIFDDHPQLLRGRPDFVALKQAA